MLFTAHLFDTSPLVAARRSAPDPGDVPGLLSSRNGVCAQFSHSFVPSPQLGREAILACWENEDAVDQFLADDPLGRVAVTGWHMRLELVRAVGMFPGMPGVDFAEIAGDKDQAMTGPSVAFTCGHAYLKTFPQFYKVNKGLERQFLNTDDAIWGTAMTNLRTRFVACLLYTSPSPRDATLSRMPSSA